MHTIFKYFKPALNCMKNNRSNLNLSLTENGSKHSEKKTCGLNGKRERQILKVSKSKGAQLKANTEKKGRREKNHVFYGGFHGQ